MRKRLIYIALLFVSFYGFSQEPIANDTIKNNFNLVSLKGQVIDFADKTPLKGAHLFNLNSVFGTITNDNGNFEIATTVNDTIYVSYLGFQSIKLKITNDLCEKGGLRGTCKEGGERLNERDQYEMLGTKSLQRSVTS